MSGFGMGQTSNQGIITGGGFGQAIGPMDVTNMDASTPWVAASDGNLPLLQQSLAALLIPIDAADENGYTLLQAAASYNHVPVLTWLLTEIQQQEKLSAINAVDKEGDSALHYAGGAVAAKFLVEKAQIDVKIRNTSGQTALEAKQEELEEMKQDEDFEEDDIDAINLKETIEYLVSLSTLAQ